MVASSIEASLWYATAADPPATVPLDGETSADVCVIGAGYTGLSSALHLAEKGVRVVVVEARSVGFGCSGRNAGHCTPTFHFYSIPTVRKMLGPVYGERLVERQTNAANLVFDLIKRYDIDCEGVQNGYLMVAHAPSKVKVLEEKQQTYASAGKVTELLDKDETERLTGSPRYYGAWHHPEGGHLNPLGYARGLARARDRPGRHRPHRFAGPGDQARRHALAGGDAARCGPRRQGHLRHGSLHGRLLARPREQLPADDGGDHGDPAAGRQCPQDPSRRPTTRWSRPAPTR